MIYCLQIYRGFYIWYDAFYDEYFIADYPFHEDYGYYEIEDAMDAIDDFLWELESLYF